jgi:hypothetical protein
MRAAYLFFLFLARLSLEPPPDPHQTPLPVPILVSLVDPEVGAFFGVPTAGAAGSKAGTMGRAAAKSPEEKAFTKAAGVLSKKCWDDGLGDLLIERGVDTRGATWAHGGLYLGALCGLWTSDVETQDYRESPAGLAAFAAMAPGLLKEVSSISLHDFCFVLGFVHASNITFTDCYCVGPGEESG